MILVGLEHVCSGSTVIVCRLVDFAAQHGDAGAPLDAWYRVVKAKSYASPADVKRDFPTASFLSDSRVVFNIGGNKYRLTVTMRYEMGQCFIRSVLTHAAYDRHTTGAREAGRSEERPSRRRVARTTHNADAP